MEGSIPMFNLFPLPVRMQQAPVPKLPTQQAPHPKVQIQQAPLTNIWTQRTPLPIPINMIKQEPIGHNVAQPCIMYNHCSTPAQFQLPPDFQQLPDAVPIKQEPQDPSQLQLQQQQEQAPGKSKAKKKKIKKEPVIRSGNIPDAPGEDGNVPKKKLKQEKITEHLTVKKKRDRFNGMPEEEVVLRLLPDHLKEDLDIVIVGINPGLFAAYVGHHYAGPGNHFWKCLYLSGLIPEPMNAYQDFELPKFGIGFTNICARTTRGSADLKKTEIKEGAAILKEKLKKWRPKIAAFNGKGIYEVYCGHKNFILGKQPEPVEGTDTIVYVMPSSSARCAQLPRAVDKVPFYLALKKLRDYCRGDTPHLDESEVCFPDLELKIKTEPKTEPVDITEGVASSQSETKPQVESKPKSKGKKNKSANPPKTSQSENIPVSSSQVQSTNGMWPVVKEEKPYDASEYGGQTYNPVSSADMLVSTQMMPVYQTSHIYSQPSNVAQSQSVSPAGDKTIVPAPAVMARTDTANTSAMFYTGMQQPVYQGQLFPQGTFLQQLQDSSIAQNTTQTWQQYPTYPAGQMLNDNSSNQTAVESADDDADAVQVKTEPQEYGYTEISFNNM